MNLKNALSLLSLLLLLLVDFQSTKACSMYKFTANGKTMVGCNEDAWRVNSRIWFANARNTNEYGAAFTGSRQVGTERFAPQSGMNEKGLVFSRLASSYPKQNIDWSSRKKIKSEVKYATDILHKCATIDEVKAFIEQYDHSVFIGDIFIYIDSSGKYLLVEPYKLIEGDNAEYVLSNFCPSITDNNTARQLERYRNGEDFFKNHATNASIDFCRTLSDTMHVCRKNGDGTLLTSIWNTQDKLVNLYFYHAYDSTIQFNIQEELAKGDHMLDIISLFPENAEFKHLVAYITPFNTPSLRIALVFIGGGLVSLALLFTFLFIRNRKANIAYKVLLLTSILNLILTGYFFVLATNIYVYYFDAPYQNHASTWISLSSYTPFLFLLAIIPSLVLMINFVKNIEKKIGLKTLLITNNLIYIVSLLGFAYWGFFNII